MEKLKNQLYGVMIQSGLPIEQIYYILKDIYREMSDTYQQFLIEQTKNEQNNNELNEEELKKNGNSENLAEK